MLERECSTGNTILFAMRGATGNVILDALNAFILSLVHGLYLSLTVAADGAHWLFRRRHSPLPATMPAHIGIVVGGSEAAAANGSFSNDGHNLWQEQIEQLAAVIGWCYSAGIRYVTVCDARGALVRAASELCNQLHAEGMPSACVLASGEEPLDGAPAVRVISLKSGRDDLVDAARTLCERVRAGDLKPSSIDERAVEGELRANAGFPEPSLVLQCCPELHLGGLLPWHCRVTQYVHVGELDGVTQDQVHRALVEFASVQQRHGK